MSKQPTAVDWLYQELWKQTDFSLPSTIYEQANKMFEQQIIDAVESGGIMISGEEYYNETYGE